MTLKSFHFAGVASMNITQGVPRMEEIINAAKKIKSPVIEVVLKKSFLQNPGHALEKIYKNLRLKIEKTYLDEITVNYSEVYSPKECYLMV
jgi:DNA-directed RNA polymerase III subunit RPC1